MKIGVIGYKGMVGKELVKRGYTPIACDVIDVRGMRHAVESDNYEAIIYAAGITDVDFCEENYKEAMKVNAWGVSNLVDFYPGRVIYISTDHVFSGKSYFHKGYTEKHFYSAVNNYGWSKMGGEKAVSSGLSDAKVIRTSKLFNRKALVELQFLEKRNVPREYSTVLKRSFLHVQHFVDGLQFVLENWERIPPILNIAGTDIMTHYMFYCAIARKFDISLDLLVPKHRYTEDKAPRPKRGGLNVRMARKLGVTLYSAHEGIELL